jgi:hypothetical protein
VSPPLLLALQARCPVTRVRTLTGDKAWTMAWRRALAAPSLDYPSVRAGGEVATDRDLRHVLLQHQLRVLVLLGVAIYLVLPILPRNLFAPVYVPLLASVRLWTAAAIGWGQLYCDLANQPLYHALIGCDESGGKE